MGANDAGGNDLSVNGNTAAYDAENRLNTVSESPGLGRGSETLSYDGIGQRVQKMISGGATTVYVHDAFGNLAAEYSPASTLAKDYIRFSGQVVAVENTAPSPCQTCYFSYDHLGSVRLVTDQNATIISRHDYLSFGEEIPGNIAGRNSQWDVPDGITQRFTGQTRDSETGEDFFNMRYFTAPLGRFNSPDPGQAGVDITNPQSWNGYTYVGNNPLNAIDPSGMACYPLEKKLFGSCAPVMNNGVNFGSTWNEFELMNIPVISWTYIQSSASISYGTGGTDAADFPGHWEAEQLGTGFDLFGGLADGGGGDSENQQPPKNGTLRQFWHCVASGTDYFSLQNGPRAISGGRFGNGWLAGAFLGNSVQSFGDTIEAVADFNFGKAANVAGAEALGDTTGPLVTNAASRVPNVAITVGGAVAASVATGSYSGSASIAGSATFNLSKAATGAAGFIAKPLAVLGTIKLPIDLAVAGFSAVACGVNF